MSSPAESFAKRLQRQEGSGRGLTHPEWLPLAAALGLLLSRALSSGRAGTAYATTAGLSSRQLPNGSPQSEKPRGVWGAKPTRKTGAERAFESGGPEVRRVLRRQNRQVCTVSVLTK